MIAHSNRTANRWIAGFIAVLTVLTLSTPGYSWVERNQNGHVVLLESPITMLVLSNTFAAEELNAVEKGTVLWDGIKGVRDMLDTLMKPSASVALGNGDWEVSGWPRGADYLDGAVGVTMCDISDTTGYIIECDIGIDRDMPTMVQNEMDSYLSFLETITHEFGHVLGMGHEDAKMSIMCSRNTCGRMAGRNAAGSYVGNYEFILPDDVDYIVAHYGLSTVPGRVDPFTSGWRWNARWTEPQPIYTSQYYYNVCPGATITYRFSIGNMGKPGILQSSPVTYGVVISSNSVISKYDTMVHSGVYWGNTRWISEAIIPITVPASLTPGATYYLGSIVDYNNEFTENYEYNNASGGTFRITIRTDC
jgi:hypothetical protein